MFLRNLETAYKAGPNCNSEDHKVSKVHPCTGTEALYRRTPHRGSRGIAVLFHDHGTRRG